MTVPFDKKIKAYMLDLGVREYKLVFNRLCNTKDVDIAYRLYFVHAGKLILGHVYMSCDNNEFNGIGNFMVVDDHHKETERIKNIKKYLHD